MGFLTQLWNWLNGNKTFFGMAILLVLQQGWLPSDTIYFEMLQWLAGLLTGGGLLHKLKKANTKAEPNM